jgi:hypothetical protein
MGRMTDVYFAKISDGRRKITYQDKATFLLFTEGRNDLSKFKKILLVTFSHLIKEKNNMKQELQTF